MPRPLFTVSAGMRIIDAAVYASIAALYQFGFPVIHGVAPDTLAATYSAPIRNDATFAEGNLLPAILTNTLTSQVLGVPVSTAVGSGTVTGVSYTDANGVLWTEVDWEWVVGVEFYAVVAAKGGWDQEIVTWTGNGVNGRLIPTSFSLIEGVVAVWIFPTSPGECTFRHSSMAASITVQRFNAADGITSLTAAGFTVSDNTGQNVRVNINTATYMAIILRDTTEDNIFLRVGQYAGNGAARDIAAGLAPDLVWIFGRAGAGAHKSDLHPAAGSCAWSNEAGKPLTTQITALSASGFSVGTDNNVNHAALTYYWMAIANPVGGRLRPYIGSFELVGAGADYDVTGLGFLPGFAGIKQYLVTPSTNTGWRGAWHTLKRSTTWGATVVNSGVVEAFGADGLTVGAASAALGTTVYGVAFKTTGSLFAEYAPATPPAASNVLGATGDVGTGDAGVGTAGCASSVNSAAIT